MCIGFFRHTCCLAVKGVYPVIDLVRPSLKREAAGISYEELAQQLQAERMRTMREKYPDFTAAFAPDAASKPA